MRRSVSHALRVAVLEGVAGKEGIASAARTTLAEELRVGRLVTAFSAARPGSLLLVKRAAHGARLVPFGSGRGPAPPLRPSPRQGIARPVVFCTAVSTAAFAAAAVAEERSFRQSWDHFASRTGFQRRGWGHEKQHWSESMPTMMQNIYREFWMDVSPQQRIVTAITAVHVTIFGVFRGVPALRGVMTRNFVHALPPLPCKARTLLTSNFTHLGGMHLLVNTLAFWSFGTEAARILGAEQFLAFYVSAGLASGLTSHLGRLRSLPGGLSVGASGAIYACFALTAITRPDQEVVVIFLPWLPIQIGDALAVTMTLDCLGALLGWRTFDHLGHLGGAIFGLYYALRGQRDVWPRFQDLAEKLGSRQAGR